MPEKKLRSIILEDVRIFGRNFEGLPTKYNPQGGRRKFCVFLKDDVLQRFIDEGWKVKYLKPLDEDADPRAFLEVEVKFGKYPPRIVMIGSNGKTDLNQATAKLLDWAPATKIDLIVNPSEWEVLGNSGVKAYLKSIFYTIYEDELDLKYANVPDSASSAILSDHGYGSDDED